MFDRFVQPIGAIGTGKQSWPLPGGYQIASVSIDNPSGSWLFIKQDGTYVPPYTLDFAHNFNPTIAQIDILFSNGPAGQVSTQQGDSPTFLIYSDRIAEQLGTSSPAGFIQNFTPLVFASGQGTARFSTTVTISILAGVANRRYRIKQMSVVYSGAAGSSFTTQWQAPVNFNFVTNTNGVFVFARGAISPRLPLFTKNYDAGYDLPVGCGFDCQTFGSFANTDLNVTAEYQVI